MIRFWKTCGLSFLATLVLTAGTRAGEGDGGKPEGDPIKALNKKIDNLSEQIKAEFIKIDGSFQKVGSDMKGVKDANVDLNLKLQDALDRIKTLEKALDLLKRDPKKFRETFFAGPGPEKPAGAGKLVLENSYVEDMLFIVNLKPYRIAPGKTMVFDLFPAGEVSYEIVSPTWGLRARTKTVLGPGETITLTAR